MMAIDDHEHDQPVALCMDHHRQPRFAQRRWRASAVVTGCLLPLWPGAGGAGLLLAEDAPGPINELCPVMPEEKANPLIVAQYRDRTVAFCCEKCRARFTANPGRYAARLGLVATEQTATPLTPDKGISTTASVSADALHDHRDHDHVPWPRILTWLGKFHPAAVHLPIGLLLGAAIAEVAFLLRQREAYRSARQFCITLGAISAVLAAALGWLYALDQGSSERWLLTWHRWLGTGTAVFWVIVALLMLDYSRVKLGQRIVLARALILAGAGLVLVTGFLGGALVYGLNHYAW